MGLKGTFSFYSPRRLHGYLRMWQFVLKNTNLLFGETIDLMLSDANGNHPFYFRNLHLKAGESVAFNIDTENWTWCQDDYAAIINSKNKILKKWTFHLKEYKPGECPECHGTGQCRSCNGKGFIYPHRRIWEVHSCNKCTGTGVCQTCYIPRRSYNK